MARIVLNTFGSLGDLHPYLAVAWGLKARGHVPVIATSGVYRAKVEALGLEFAAVRPDVGELMDRPEFIAKLWHPKQGTKYLLRDYLIPQVADSLADLKPACEGADLLLTHSAAYAGPIVGELLGIPWLSVALQPAVFFSALDPSVVAPAPWLRHTYFLGPWWHRFLLRIAERRVSTWIGPILKLRQELGLPAPRLNPVTLGQFSPFGSIALFSKHFAPPQQDWPGGTKQTGFVFYDELGEGLPGSESKKRNEVPPALAEFLASGKPPVLFTLGSSAVMEAGDFFVRSLRAAEQSGERAILLVGSGKRIRLPEKVSPSVFLADYIPYSEVMPRVSAIIHQGGIGTTAQALRAGKPMLIVPWAHDQPDNAERVRKLGVGRWIGRGRYTSDTAARELEILLGSRGYSARAAEVGNKVRTEDGVANACEAIESLLVRSARK